MNDADDRTDWSTPDQRHERGKVARKAVPRSSHAEWVPPADRGDPVAVITDQDADRLQWLVPIRHGRMAESSFAFYRGSAAIMATDLASTPTSGFDAQLCGDAHLSNFGGFASAERTLVFDVNDFDETLPGPWEWDVKRLATSFVLAGRENGFDRDDTSAAATRTVEAYRSAMAGFAESVTLNTWYSQLAVDKIIDDLSHKGDRKRVEKAAAKARSRNVLKATKKLTDEVDGELRIVSNPPLLFALRDLPDDHADKLHHFVTESWSLYRSTLRDDRRVLLDRYRILDMALKVVGVGSVGTRCLLVLLKGRDEHDPLLLQIKQAGPSVLEAHLAPSAYDAPGERVVTGRRLIQASSDVFLGWSSSDAGHHFYWRQFHDMKGSADYTTMSPRRLTSYAHMCGWTLAHAHARSGDPIAMAGYLGKGDSFDKAITKFAFAYADQNDSDYKAFSDAIDSGQISAEKD
jgi:uncharacterized protein (DUF2252 family)